MTIQTKENYTLGILLKILNGLLFIAMSVLISKTALTLPTTQVLFIRVVLGSVFCAFCLKMIGQSISFSMPREKLVLYLVRGAANFLGMITWIEALKTLGINEATVLMYTGPIWTILMARLFLKEQFKLAYFCVMALNILGVLVILRPGFNNFNWFGVGSALLSALIWSVYSMISKKQTVTEHYMVQTFYTFALSALVMAPFALIVWQPVPQEMLLSLTMSSMAVAAIGVLNVTVLFLAYVNAPIIIVEPFNYMRLVFASIVSYFIYQIPLTTEFLIGSLIILSANFYFFVVKERITFAPKNVGKST